MRAAVPLLLLFAVSCSDVLEPGPPEAPADDDPVTSTEQMIIALQQGADSTCMAGSENCGFVQVDEEVRCMCWNYEPFVVQADPEEPDHWNPGPAPEDLQAPIWPDPGSSPSGHDPGDPCEWDCPIVFDVEIWCRTNLVRGEQGRCELEVDPPGVLHSIDGWTFKGKGDGYEGLNAWTQSYHQDYWQGPIVASGEVRVDFKVADEFDNTFPVAAKTEVAVEPRQWTWQSIGGITMKSSTSIMDWPSTSNAIGTVCRPNEPCPMQDQGHIVQPDTGFAHQNGYIRTQVSGGPNDGLWYVQDVTMDVHMVAMVNPDYLPENAWPPPVAPAKYPITGSHAQACGAAATDTIFRAFIEYNEKCRFHDQYLVPFETWAWNHEATHMANALTYTKEWAHPYVDAAATLESVVKNLALQLDTEAEERLKHIPDCVRDAAATHGHLSLILDPFPGIPDFTWLWKPEAGSMGEFQKEDPGWIWWGAGADPFSGVCVP